MSTDQAVVVWGEVLWDLFPDGVQLGGAPANVAWHVGLAGGWARLVSRVGNDEYGRGAIARLDDVVDTSLVQIDRERLTGVVEVAVEAGEPRYRLVPDRAWERIACTDDVREALDEAGVMVFGTLAQRTREGLAAWRAAVEHARCMKVCDVNLRRTEQRAEGEELLAAIEAADVIKVNDEELAHLGEWYGWHDPLGELRKRPRMPGSPPEAIERLGAGCPRLVAVTHGADGSTLHGESGSIEIAGVRARAVGDNVGCGDAYLAILVHGMTLGWDLARSGRAASRWAAAVAECRGATPRFSDEQIVDLLELS